MKKEALVLAMLAISLVVAGCVTSGGDIQKYSEKAVLSKEELAEIGIIVDNEPLTTNEPAGLFEAHKEGYKGDFFVMYGDPTPLGYGVQLYDNEDNAKAAYNENYDLLDSAGDQIVQSRWSDDPFIIVGIENEAGKENLSMFYRHKNFCIFMIATSELNEKSVDYDYEKLITLAEKISEKLDSADAAK